MRQSQIWLSFGVAFAAVAGIAVCFAKYNDWVTLPRERELISKYMKDPAATQFRNDRITPDGWLCGEFNSKNEYGAYTGFKRFTSHTKSGAVYVEGLSLITEDDFDRSHEEVIALLDKRIALSTRQIAARGRGEPITKYTEGERNRMAREERFEDRWKDLCVK
ncbi:hypothetical protein BA896_001475 [Janthinobacterium lividum]|uniref:Uncharacterized protein n=1 Tax=Janthinobacterium lividum TaxID=29581 RepID=A0A1E8PNH6_9BURK|nr:hypothetical protein BA896_001475 [Janthinobacterium lividum]